MSEYQMTIETPRQMIEHLVTGLTDRFPDSAGTTPEKVREELPRRLGAQMQADLTAYGTLDRCLTPRDQARGILSTMAGSSYPFWDGFSAIKDLLRLHKREVLPTEISFERLAAAYCYPIAVRAHARSILPTIGVVQPVERPVSAEDKQAASALYVGYEECELGQGRALRLFPVRQDLALEKFQIGTMTSVEQIQEFAAAQGASALSEMLMLMAEQFARELNRLALNRLADAAAVIAPPQTAEVGLFERCAGIPTARFFGPEAARQVLGGLDRTCSEPFAGITQVHGFLTDTFVVQDWTGERAGTCLLLRAQPWELTAPLAYLPWLWLGTIEVEGETYRHYLRHFAACEVVEPRLVARVDLK